MKLLNSIFSLILEIIVQGKIPFLPLLKKIILFLSVVPLFGIFFLPEDFRDLGGFSWNLLLIILLIRPLGDVFIDFKILKRLLPLRKELGILCGTLGISHSIGYFFDEKISLPAGFFDAEIWDITGYYFWGMIGFIIAILLTLTSNIFSLTFFKTYWKKLHKLTYVFVVVIAIHIVLIQASSEGTFVSLEVWESALPLFFLSILWVISSQKITISVAKFFPFLFPLTHTKNTTQKKK